VTALSRLHVGVGIGLIAALTDRVLIFAAQPVRPHSAEPKAVIAV
jgi:cytochrome b561